MTTTQKITGKQIVKGDKVQINTGEWYSVECVYGNMVYVYGSQRVIHASNVVSIKHDPALAIVTAAEAEAINSEIASEVHKIKSCLPRIESWAALSIACERVLARRNGPQLDPDPTGAIAAQAESEYSHSEGAHS